MPSRAVPGPSGTQSPTGPNGLSPADRKAESKAKEAKREEQKRRQSLSAPHGFGSLADVSDETNWREHLDTNIALLDECGAVTSVQATVPSEWCAVRPI